MPRFDRPFSLCETISGVFAEICDKYDIDSTWLSWQFERAIWTGKTSPLRIGTNELVQKRSIKEGVEKVTFEIRFDHEHPNDVTAIRFTELPTKKVFLVTQTSIQHVQDETKCPLWVELPPAARKEDIGAIQALLKVEVCCTDWKDFLPKEPWTALERAHLVMASGDEFWLKKQVIHKDMTTHSLSQALETKIAEVDELKKEVDRLTRELEETNACQAAPSSPTTPPSPARKKRRLVLTPAKPPPKKPTSAKTAPAKTAGYDTRHLVPVETPTRTRATEKRPLGDESDPESRILFESLPRRDSFGARKW